MVRTLIDFAPAELAMAPRPLEGELTSSWLSRVAAANLVELEELLSALLDLYGVPLSLEPKRTLVRQEISKE